MTSRPPSTSARRASRQLCLLCLLCQLCLSACDGAAPAPAAADEPLDMALGASCALDPLADPASAAPLAFGPDGVGERVEGYICPPGDEDWYSLSLPRAAVLTVTLSAESEVTPVDLTYDIYPREGDAAGALAASLPGGRAGRVRSAQHCVEAGELVARVRDSSGRAQDPRAPYTLTLSASLEPDEGEPRGWEEGAGEGRALASGVPATGYISCVGDADRFTLALPPRALVEWTLEMPTPAPGDPGGGVRPQVRALVGGEELLKVARVATDGDAPLLRALSVPEGGALTLIVEDATGARSSLTQPYTLTARVMEDSDLNEPNNAPAAATDLASSAPLRCEEEWGAWREAAGVVGTLGDLDWYALRFEGCERGLLEAEVRLADEALSREESYLLQRRLQLTAALVRPDELSPCEAGAGGADLSCRALEGRACSSAWECAGLGASCGADGRCAGAVVCLPEGRCGAAQVERRYELPANATPLALPEHAALLSAPLYSPPPLYLRVGDFGGDAASVDARYVVRVRARRDPDVHEPSNVYTDELRRDDPAAAQVRFAQGRPWLPVHDCSAGVYPPPQGGAGGDKSEDMGVVGGLDQGALDMSALDMGALDLGAADLGAADLGAADLGAADLGAADLGAPLPPGALLPSCCASPEARWTEGALSYEDDVDLYTYAHPCPGEDCMVKIYYEVDEGPAELLMQVYESTSLWFEPLVPASDERLNPAASGVFGGLAPQDACFYAWQGHTGDAEAPFLYTIALRDLRPTRDWSADQRYRICVEKAGNGCFEPPCELADPATLNGRVGGCGVPRP